jgi:hypothetical protein
MVRLKNPRPLTIERINPKEMASFVNVFLVLKKTGNVFAENIKA